MRVDGEEERREAALRWIDRAVPAKPAPLTLQDVLEGARRLEHVVPRGSVHGKHSVDPARYIAARVLALPERVLALPEEPVPLVLEPVPVDVGVRPGRKLQVVVVRVLTTHHFEDFLPKFEVVALFVRRSSDRDELGALRCQVRPHDGEIELLRVVPELLVDAEVGLDAAEGVDVVAAVHDDPGAILENGPELRVAVLFDDRLGPVELEALREPVNIAALLSGWSDDVDVGPGIFQRIPPRDVADDLGLPKVTAALELHYALPGLEERLDDPLLPFVGEPLDVLLLQMGV